MRSGAHGGSSGWVVAAGLLTSLAACGGAAHAQTLDLGEPEVRTAQGPWSAQVLELLSETPETSFGVALYDIARLLTEHAAARPGEAAAALLLAHSIGDNADELAGYALDDATDPIVRTMVLKDLEKVVENPPSDVAGFERELRDALAPLTAGVHERADMHAGWFLASEPAPVDAIVVNARLGDASDRLPASVVTRLQRLIGACEAGSTHPAYARSAAATLAELARAVELASPPDWLGEDAVQQSQNILAGAANTAEPQGRAELLARAAGLSRLLRAIGELPDGAAADLARQTMNSRLAEAGASPPGLVWLRIAREAAEEAVQTPDRPVPDGFIRTLRPAWVAARKDEQQARAALLQLVPRVLASDSSISDPAVLAALRAARDSGFAFERLERFNTAATEGAAGAARPVASKAWKDVTDRAGELARSNPAALRDLVSQAARFSELPGERAMRDAIQNASLGSWSPSLGRGGFRMLDVIEETRVRWRDAWATAQRTADAESEAIAMTRLERLSRLLVADHTIARAEDDTLAGWPGWPMSASARTLLATDLRIAVITASEPLLGIDPPSNDDTEQDPPDPDEMLDLAERVAAPALARVALAERAMRNRDGADAPGTPSASVARLRRGLSLVAFGPPVRGREWLGGHRLELAGLAAATEQRVAAELNNHDDLADLYAGLAREHAEAILAVLWRE